MVHMLGRHRGQIGLQQRKEPQPQHQLVRPRPDGVRRVLPIGAHRQEVINRFDGPPILADDRVALPPAQWVAAAERL
jgi:hypothetical protein